MLDTVKARNTVCKSKLKVGKAAHQTMSHAMPRVNNICPGDALHDDFPSSFFVAPRWCTIVLTFRVCIPLLLGERKCYPLCTKTHRKDLPRCRLSPALIHPSAASLSHTRGPPPKALLTTPNPQSLTLRCCGFPGLYAGCCLRQIEDPLCASAPVLSGWEEPAEAASGETGMRI